MILINSKIITGKIQINTIKLYNCNSLDTFIL